MGALVALANRKRVLSTVTVDEAEELRVEATVQAQERLEHALAVRIHLRAAMKALSAGRYALAGTWLVELERLNEREATQARAASTTNAAEHCPDGIHAVGHGRAA